MKFTVAICTWNRADSLRLTLDSLAALQPPPCDWELLVVNNNCTDATESVIQLMAGKLPLRSVVETEQGHSASRNAAVREALGEYIVWTDDDVLADPSLLCAYQAATETYPQATFFGGPIIPRFQSPPPRWITENWELCKGMFAARDLGDVVIPFDENRLPYGANLVIRRAALAPYAFDHRLGRAGRSVRGFDEVDLLLRLLRDGHTGYWIPDATIEHRIPPSRMTIRYARDYFFGQGQTWIIRGREHLDAPSLRREIRRMHRRYWLERLRPARLWFPQLAALSNLRGQLSMLAS